ncbi:Crp/Fnr family transcriptional regulator [Paenibacillus sp. GCM10027628]|uniref:Crp/Fnr family transcriptional regulator n=1 Tax=Paenibacillus sp. GCM10027628 TaxID=3273413 RepID=UPI0036268185
MTKWDSLGHFLDGLLPLSENQKNRFYSLFTPITMDKNEHLLLAGERTEHLYFCLSGSFRMYYSTYDGKERIKAFCGADDFITSYSSLLTGSPSSLSIQALQPAKLIQAYYPDFLALTLEDPVWERLARLITEGMYLKKERREMQLLTLSAEERYACFQQEFGTWEARIPQYYIASYLGITPVALSRIRSKNAIRPFSLT